MAQIHNHSKKLILTLTILTVIMATFCFTKQTEASNRIATQGDIKIYTENGKSELTSISFPLFTAGKPDTQQKWFTVQNTGKQNVHVSWSITQSSITWNHLTKTKQNGYSHTESSSQKYTLRIRQDKQNQNTYLNPEQNTILLKNKENTKLCLELTYTGKPTTAETFTLTITLTATKTES